MKVIFVGMHNKPDTNPLCIFTKSGKMLQRVINQFPKLEFEKTNLYDIDHYPTTEKDFEEPITWHWRILPTSDDLIILLGACVHNDFILRNGYKVRRFAHPASKWSHKAMDEYVNKMTKSINDYLKLTKEE